MWGRDDGHKHLHLRVASLSLPARCVHWQVVLNSTLCLERIIHVVSKTFGEWYQETKKTEDTDKLTLLASKIIAILHNTLSATFIKLLETGSKGLFRNRSQNRCHTFLDCRHILQNVRLSWCSSGGETERSPPTVLLWSGARRRQIRGVRWTSSTRFLDHTKRHATVGRTPLDEWSACRRDLYVTIHNSHNRQTSMPPVVFESTMAVGERP
jgi:hypothetical protein